MSQKNKQNESKKEEPSLSDEITKLFAKYGMKVREIKGTKGCRIGFFKNND